MQTLEKLVLSDALNAELQLKVLLAQVRRTTAPPELEVNLLCVYAAALYFQSKIPEAQDAYTRVIELGRDLPDQRTHIRALNGLGNLACLQGDYDNGLEHYYRSAHLAQQHGDETGRQRASSNLALMYARFGHHEEALGVHQGLIAAAQRIGFTQQVVNARVNVIEDYLGMQEHEQVRAHSDAFLLDPVNHEYPQYIAVVKSLYARSLVALGDYQTAQQLTDEALPILEDLAYQEYLGHSFLIRSEVEHHLGEPELAHAAAQFALNIGNEFGLLPLQGQAHTALATLMEEQDNLKAALEHLRQAQRIERQLHAQQLRHGLQLMNLRLRIQTEHTAPAAVSLIPG